MPLAVPDLQLLSTILVPALFEPAFRFDLLHLLAHHQGFQPLLIPSFEFQLMLPL